MVTVLDELTNPPFEPIDTIHLYSSCLLLALASAKRVGDLAAFSLHQSCTTLTSCLCALVHKHRFKALSRERLSGWIVEATVSLWHTPLQGRLPQRDLKRILLEVWKHLGPYFGAQQPLGLHLTLLSGSIVCS